MVGPAGSELIGRALDKEAPTSEKRRKVLEVREDAGSTRAPSLGGAGVAAGDLALPSRPDRAQSERKRLRGAADKAGPHRGAGQPGQAGRREK